MSWKLLTYCKVIKVLDQLKKTKIKSNMQLSLDFIFSHGKNKLCSCNAFPQKNVHVLHISSSRLKNSQYNCSLSWSMIDTI